MPVIINARSHSDDPMQEHLRQRKDEWNAACRTYIARLNMSKPHLISFKRGLNGRGDAKAGLPTSSIGEAFPAEIGGYLGSVGSEFNELASMFAALVSEANGIIQEQAQYAGSRRRSQRAASHDENDGLLVEGSNAITRTWAKLHSIVQSDIAKSQRLSMLGSCAKFFKTLVQYEDLILAPGIDNVEELVKKFMLISNKIDTLVREYNQIVKIKSPPAKDKGAPTDGAATPPAGSQSSTGNESATPPADSESDTSNPKEPPHVIDNSPPNSIPFLLLKENVVAMRKAGFFSQEDIRAFLVLFHATKKETDTNKQEIMEDRVREVYLELLGKAIYKAEQKFKKKLPKNITLEQLINLQRNASISNLEMMKFSGPLSRIWNKKRHETGSTDPSSASRLEIYNLIRELKVQTDQMMDLLESKGVSVEELGKKIKEMLKLKEGINEPLGTLTMLHKDKYYEQDGKGNRKPQILDPALRYFNRQIRHDVDKPGW